VGKVVKITLLIIKPTRCRAVGKVVKITLPIIKPTRCTNFSNLFFIEILHVSDSSSVHHQELFNVHAAMVYVIQVCRQLSSSRIKMEYPDPVARKLSV
jgi:hypothetical protein